MATTETQGGGRQTAYKREVARVDPYRSRAMPGRRLAVSSTRPAQPVDKEQPEAAVDGEETDLAPVDVDEVDVDDPSLMFTVFGIVRALRAAIKKIDGLQNAPFDIDNLRTQVAALIEALEGGDPERVRELAFSTVEMSLPGEDAKRAHILEGIQRSNPIPAEWTQSPLWDASECAATIRDAALRAGALLLPEEDPVFDLWKAKISKPESVARNALGVLGNQLAGTRMYAADIAKEMHESHRKPGQKMKIGDLSKALARISPSTKGSEFELHCEKDEYGLLVFWVIASDEGALDTDKIPVKTWAAEYYDYGKNSRREKLLEWLTDHELGTEVSPRQLLAEIYEITEPNRKDLNSKIIGVVGVVVLKTEKSWGESLDRAREELAGNGLCVKDYLCALARESFTIRRVHGGPGSAVTVKYKLMNREESMKDWISKISSEGSLLERILWKMFEYGLGREFTNSELVTLLNQDGAEVNQRQVREATSRPPSIVNKSVGTEYVLEKSTCSKRGVAEAAYKICP